MQSGLNWHKYMKIIRNLESTFNFFGSIFLLTLTGAPNIGQTPQPIRVTVIVAPEHALAACDHHKRTRRASLKAAGRQMRGDRARILCISHSADVRRPTDWISPLQSVSSAHPHYDTP